METLRKERIQEMTELLNMAFYDISGFCLFSLGQGQIREATNEDSDDPVHLHSHHIIWRSLTYSTTKLH